MQVTWPSENSFVLVKPGQNVCLDDIPEKESLLTLGQKANYSAKSLEKPVHSRGHVFCIILLTEEKAAYQ